MICISSHGPDSLRIIIKQYLHFSFLTCQVKTHPVLLYIVCRNLMKFIEILWRTVPHKCRITTLKNKASQRLDTDCAKSLKIELTSSVPRDIGESVIQWDGFPWRKHFLNCKVRTESASLGVIIDNIHLCYSCRSMVTVGLWLWEGTIK